LRRLISYKIMPIISVGCDFTTKSGGIWHSLAKHHLLGACFPRMVPFRSMLLTLRGGPQCLAPRAHRVPVYPMVFSTFLYRAFTAHIAVTIAGVLLAGLARGLGLQHTVVREGMTGDHQPLLGPCAFALQACLHAAGDQLDRHRTFLALSHRQPRPYIRLQGVPPGRHRLPWWLRRPSAPLIGREWGLQVAHRGGTGDPQDIAFASLPQGLTKPCVATELIVTRHPAVRHLRAPRVEHL